MLGVASPGAEAAPDPARLHDRNAAAFPAPARRRAGAEARHPEPRPSWSTLQRMTSCCRRRP